MAVAIGRASNTPIGANLRPVRSQKRGWEGAQRWERGPKRAGGRGKGTEVKTSFSSTRSMMAVNDGKAEKELRATTVATSNGYLSDGEILAVGSYG